MTRDLKLTILKAQNGDKEAMSKLIDENIRLVWNIVNKFANRGYEQEDLFQVGCEGFIKGIKNFNFDFNTQLSTYLVPVIMGEIRRYIRDDNIVKISRSIKELSYKIYNLKEQYYAKNGEEITISKLAEELDVTVEEIVEAIESNNKPEYLDNYCTEDESGKTLGDLIPSNVNEEEEIINNVYIKNILNSMSKEDRQIIILRYFKQKSQSEISKMLGVSQVQVSRMERKILEKLRKQNKETLV